MAVALRMFRAADRILFVGPTGPVGRSVRLDPEVAAALAGDGGGGVPGELLGELLRHRPAGPLAAADPVLEGTAAALGLDPPVGRAGRRAARARGWPVPSPAEREFYLRLGALRLRQALADPVETLLTLAREEERLERTSRREAAAAEQFLAGAEGGPAEYAARWARFREGLEAHAALLRDEVDRRARTLLPNLSAVVGPRTAARLLARAGGVGPLVRMSSSRLQLLGSRRRPGAGRGPRHGLLLRAEGMEAVAPDRRGAYARSAAGLASIAVRMDAVDPTLRAERLLIRRARRLAALAREAAR